MDVPIRPRLAPELALDVKIGQMLLRFTRDKAGKVTGLEYSNPLLRKVKFTRTE